MTLLKDAIRLASGKEERGSAVETARGRRRETKQRDQRVNIKEQEMGGGREGQEDRYTFIHLYPYEKEELGMDF